MSVIAAVVIIVLAVLLRPKSFTFWCDRHQGTVTTKYDAWPRTCPVCDPPPHQR